MINHIQLRKDMSIISVSGPGFVIDAVGKTNADFKVIMKALGVSVDFVDSPQVPSDGEEIARIYDELQEGGGLDALIGKQFVGRVTYEPGQPPKLTGFGLDEDTKDD